MQKVIEGITRLEQRTGKKVHNLLNFLQGPIVKMHVTTDWSNTFWIGEHNLSSGKLHGRGIRVTHNIIYIGYFDNGSPAPGYEISIWADGRLYSGEF